MQMLLRKFLSNEIEKKNQFGSAIWRRNETTELGTGTAEFSQRWKIGGTETLYVSLVES